ncbi:putative membrane protein YhdT [Halarchaeum rubridurum]|uniref:Putative membrane protein YhdT n=1 Tax=Halarchaeum rubridurum TaxID=489911 RepID=A0A830FSV5_9EURY|nr:hypothetical protein [Halarchaeum rubridurum]MBP1953819.1 putative membrane protein YhdT [Halarchaeum rubridurum]GGM54978.1 hypothetical protein GCM10009017_01590 [Halarchaeum rubridurum]
MEWPLLFVTSTTGAVLMTAFALYIWLDAGFDRHERATSVLFTLATLVFWVTSAGGDPMLGIATPEWTEIGGVTLEILFVGLGLTVRYAAGRFGLAAEGASEGV